MLDYHVPGIAIWLWLIFAVLPTVLNGWLLGRRDFQNHTLFMQVVIIGFGILSLIYATAFMLYVRDCGEGLINALMCIFSYLLPIGVAGLFWGLGREQATHPQTA